MPSVVTWCRSLKASWQPRPVFAEEEEQCERSKRSQQQQLQSQQQEEGGEEEESRAHALATLWLL
jgi:hypothetical protein